MSGTPRTTFVCTALAPAKVNTHLAILGRRDDGFHELDTTLIAVAPCDLVEVRTRVLGAGGEDGSRRDVLLDVTGPAAGDDVRAAGDDNLAVRAARGVLDVVRAREPRAAELGLAVRLVKHVPSRAGLGGASADAAAAQLATREVLELALDHRFDRDFDDERWLELAARTGSDTAFFTAARFTGAGRATGRGERVDARTAARPYVALVVPDLGCSTPAVYGAFAEGARDARSGAPRRNDLEGAALAVEPGLGAWFDALGADFGLSGSGSSLFALRATRTEAEALLGRARAALDARGLRPRLVTVTRALGHGVRPIAIGEERAR